MTTEEKENLFIEAYSFDRLTFDEFSSKHNIERAEVSILYDRTKEQTMLIQKIRDKYNSILNRSKSDFNNFKEFFDWYQNQEKECYYCKISQNNLEQLFNQRILISKKFNGTLHIERFNSDKPYSKSNCGLACAICNNAKSDFISKNDFEIFIAPAINKYLSQKTGVQNEK